MGFRSSQQLWMRCSSRRKISPTATARPPCCWTACQRSCRTPQTSRTWSNVSKPPQTLARGPRFMSSSLTSCCFWLQTRLAWTAGFQPSATALSRYTSSNTHMHEHTHTHMQGPSPPTPSCSSSGTFHPTGFICNVSPVGFSGFVPA